MTEAVLDASVVLKWFQTEGERHVRSARSLRDAFRNGTLAVFAPPLIHIEVLNVAARRWRWDRSALVELGHALGSLGFDLREPALGSVAEWTPRGLTAYDACYVALAQAEAIPLVTDDAQILSVAPSIAMALADL